jgi:hypothetical protein
MTILTQIINYVAAALAFGEAVLWLRASRVSTPETFEIAVFVSGSEGAGMGIGQSEQLTSLAHALRQQSRLNAWAAVCAGVVAVLGAVSLISGNLVPPTP